MLENILQTMHRGNLSLRPFVVMADGTERKLEYTLSVNEAAKTATISADDGKVRDYLFCTYSDDELQCRRSFENKSGRTVSIKELGIELSGITFDCDAKDDYSYHVEDPRLYGTFTLPVDFNRTAEGGTDPNFDIAINIDMADPGTLVDRIGASPYQNFPAILVSNYQTEKGLVHGTLSQQVFYHNYSIKHESDTVNLGIFSSFKATYRLDMEPGRVLNDEWYLGTTEEAGDIEKIFERYSKVLRTKLPANYGATKINRDNLVWGTWNDGIYRAVSEEMILEETQYLKDNFPTMRWIQLDDGYHAYPRDAIGVGVAYEGPEGVHPDKFPNGLRSLTDGIRQIGLRPALWIGLKAPQFTKLYKDKAPDWFVDFDYRAKFGVLDVSREDVREFMQYAINVLCRQYGFEAVKHDFWSYAFEESHDLYSIKNKSGYEHRSWWLNEFRKVLPTDGYLQTGCDIVGGNPFLGQYFTNYRYGPDIGSGDWQRLKRCYLYGIACFATHTGDLFTPNSDAVGLFPGLNDKEGLFCVNYCLVTHTMVEIAGKLSKADPENPRLKILKKAACNPNNGQDVYFIGYDYRTPRAYENYPEAMYFKTPHFSVVENNDAMPLRTVGLFNVYEEDREFSFSLEELGLEAGEYVVTDVWTGEQYTMNDRFATNVEFHGSRLLAISKAGAYKLYDANIRINSAAVCDNVMTLEADYKYDNAELFFSAAPKAIAFEGKVLEFTTEDNLTKFAVPGKGKLTVTF